MTLHILKNFFCVKVKSYNNFQPRDKYQLVQLPVQTVLLLKLPALAFSIVMVKVKFFMYLIIFDIIARDQIYF